MQGSLRPRLNNSRQGETSSSWLMTLCIWLQQAFILHVELLGRQQAIVHAAPGLQRRHLTGVHVDCSLNGQCLLKTRSRLSDPRQDEPACIGDLYMV